MKKPSQIRVNSKYWPKLGLGINIAIKERIDQNTIPIGNVIVRIINKYNTFISGSDHALGWFKYHQNGAPQITSHTPKNAIL